jgi:hypothetical protein
MAHAITEGRAWQRLHLAGRNCELTFVFRLGYAEREAPHSPSRLLEDVVTAAPLATDRL